MRDYTEDMDKIALAMRLPPACVLCDHPPTIIAPFHRYLGDGDWAIHAPSLIEEPTFSFRADALESSSMIALIAASNQPKKGN